MQEKIKEYLEWKGTYAPRASINYKIWLIRFSSLCDNKPLEHYAISDIVKYRSWLEVRYNSATIQFAIVVLKNFFAFWQQQHYRCISPSLIKLPRIHVKSHRAITASEFEKIASVIPSNEFMSLRDLVMVHLLWDTGIRVSELCDLEVTNIDENKTSTVIATKKTGKPRIIMWSQTTQEYLMKYMAIRLGLHKTNGAKSLFVGWCTRGWTIRLTPRSVQRRVQYYVHKAGIKEKITPHSFRHGWAHKRRDQLAPLAFIQKGLGHSNPISTFVYEQYNDLEFENTARAYLN
ncbi:MAG: putative Tyrosine recombinase xerD [Bacteroidetes bacterium]|nr:MAG: putative Tyrosine recombinase xerD [Bacteroidota bacterium]